MPTHNTVTTSHKEAALGYSKFYHYSPFFDAWIPKSHFISAEFDDEGNFMQVSSIMLKILYKVGVCR
jgi:hypothetical protein